MHFVLYLGGPEELDKKSSVFEELRPSAIQKHLIFRPTLQDPQDIDQKSQRLQIQVKFWDQCHWSQVVLGPVATHSEFDLKI